MQAGITSLVGRRILAAFVAAMLVLSVMFLMAEPSAQASDHQIRICHHLGNEGYTAPIPTKSQIFDPDGHGSFSAGVHPGDIIPPFSAGSQGNNSWDDYPGKNWDAEGQAIWNANCGEPEVTTTEPEVTTTEPEVTTTEPEVTTTEPEVTTTEPEVTTTTVAATTTTIEILDSTLVNETTTTTVEILDSTIVPLDSTTSSIEDEVLGTEVLPFTGADSGMLALLAGALGLLGSLILVATKERAED